MHNDGVAACVHCTYGLASYPGLLTPAFVACSTNAEEGLVKLSCAVTYLDVWRSGTFMENLQVSTDLAR